MEAGTPRKSRGASPAYVTASHRALFADDARACDACGALLPDASLPDASLPDASLPDPSLPDAALSDASPDDTLEGAGVYVTARGDEVRREVVPLCPTCGVAIGMAAHALWNIEEEEG